MRHYDAFMRTTITIDDDVAKELKARAKRSDKSLKEVLNDCLRLAFSVGRAPMGKMKHFQVRPFRTRFRTGVDMDKLNQLNDELQVENRIPELRKRK